MLEIVAHPTPTPKGKTQCCQCELWQKRSPKKGACGLYPSWIAQPKGDAPFTVITHHNDRCTWGVPKTTTLQMELELTCLN